MDILVYNTTKAVHTSNNIKSVSFQVASYAIKMTQFDEERNKDYEEDWHSMNRTEACFQDMHAD